MHIIPRFALEVDEAGNNGTSKRQVEVLRLAHRGNGSAVDEHVADHAAAEGREHRDEEEAHDVIAALPRHRSANHAHEEDTNDVGPVVQRLDQWVHLDNAHGGHRIGC